jgi:hypothetical protein
MTQLTPPTTPAPDGTDPEMALPALIPQPAGLTLPIRVPVLADCAGALVPGEVIGSTSNVLLLQAHDTAFSQVPLGTPVRLKLEWDRQLLGGRIAAHGVAGRVLVALGERAIRRSRRFAVDLPGMARSAHLAVAVEVRVTDLSAGGARVEGIALPLGSDVDLHFAPPNRAEPLNVLGFVVRAIEGSERPAIGVAFRLVQRSVDVLGGTTLAPA